MDNLTILLLIFLVILLGSVLYYITKLREKTDIIHKLSSENTLLKEVVNRTSGFDDLNLAMNNFIISYQNGELCPSVPSSMPKRIRASLNHSFNRIREGIQNILSLEKDSFGNYSKLSLSSKGDIKRIIKKINEISYDHNKLNYLYTSSSRTLHLHLQDTYIFITNLSTLLSEDKIDYDKVSKLIDDFKDTCDNTKNNIIIH